jgi:hypothetical protein
MCRVTNPRIERRSVSAFARECFRDNRNSCRKVEAMLDAYGRTIG